MKRWLALALIIMVTAGLALPLGGCLVPAEVTPIPATFDLGEILSRAAGIASLKYDAVLSLPPAPGFLTFKAWEKGDKVRWEATEGGQGVTVIWNPDKQRIYSYDPAQNTATSSPFDVTGALFLPPTATGLSRKLLANPEAKVVGADTLEGKDCVVVEYPFPEGSPDPGRPAVTAWIWVVWGIPLRVLGPVVLTEFKNIEFVDIPDSMFELPPGVQIEEW